MTCAACIVRENFYASGCTGRDGQHRIVAWAHMTWQPIFPEGVAKQKHHLIDYQVVWACDKLSHDNITQFNIACKNVASMGAAG